MIRITSDIVISEKEIKMDFIRASGPGGQNVNKVSTAVQLRFDVINSSSLCDDVRQRLIRLAGKKMTEEGILVLKAGRFRTQDRNRQDAIERLVQLIVKAAEKPKPRVRTRPSKKTRERRLADKRHRSQGKQTRRPVSNSEE